MGGDPTPGGTRRVIDAVVRGGADMLEIGIPFSDPIADGKSIQAAAARAFSSQTTPNDVLTIALDAKRRHGLPVILMTYFNILFSSGLEEFLERSRKNSIDGLIVPDLPLDEAASYAKIARGKDMDTILLAAPTSSADRMRRITKQTSGFLYLVSLLGVTGARTELEQSTVELIRAAKRFTSGKIPLGVGFGISQPEHVRRAIEAGADAVIVGSGIVDRVGKYKGTGEEALRDVEGYVTSLKEATRQMSHRR
jgi:tryptophan synthase alpha chain